MLLLQQSVGMLTHCIINNVLMIHKTKRSLRVSQERMVYVISPKKSDDIQLRNEKKSNFISERNLESSMRCVTTSFLPERNWWAGNNVIKIDKL